MCHPNGCLDNCLDNQSSRQPPLTRRRPSLNIFLKVSSSVCAVMGGVLLASRIETSGYGFVFLAMSSSQLLMVSIREQELTMIVYAGSVFLFVDCFGVYRWLIA